VGWEEVKEGGGREGELGEDDDEVETGEREGEADSCREL